MGGFWAKGESFLESVKERLLTVIVGAFQYTGFGSALDTRMELFIVS